MSDYLVLKKTGDQGQAFDWTPVTIARGIEHEDPEGAEVAAVKQAYTGEGTYKALLWDEDTEARVGPPAPPEVTMVSRREIELAEAESALTPP